jgi:four helix bundle protein
MTNVQGPMTKEYTMSKLQYPEISSDGAFMINEDGERKFDLQERTARFGEAIIHFAKKIPKSPQNTPLISQIVRCGTSIGANYCEADDAVSRKEFHNKIGTCKKEAKETKFFLRMIAAAEDSLRDDARLLWKEARELHLIFCAIFNKK